MPLLRSGNPTPIPPLELPEGKQDGALQWTQSVFHPGIWPQLAQISALAIESLSPTLCFHTVPFYQPILPAPQCHSTVLSRGSNSASSSLARPTSPAPLPAPPPSNRDAIKERTLAAYCAEHIRYNSECVALPCILAICHSYHIRLSPGAHVLQPLNNPAVLPLVYALIDIVPTWAPPSLCYLVPGPPFML